MGHSWINNISDIHHDGIWPISPIFIIVGFRLGGHTLLPMCIVMRTPPTPRPFHREVIREDSPRTLPQEVQNGLRRY